MSTFHEDVASLVLGDDRITQIVRTYARQYVATLLTAPQVALHMNVSPSTVYAWRWAGRIEALRAGGRWLFDPGEVARVELERKVRARQVAA